MTERTEAWDALQARLATQAETRACSWSPAGRVLALDVQYSGDLASVAAAERRLDGESFGIWLGSLQVDVPYEAGYFSFREGPPLLAMVTALRAASLAAPDVLLVDGHGIAHPRRCGLATWLGLGTGLPTVGCAKESLLPWEGDLADSPGSTLPVLSGGEPVGLVVRTREAVNPVFVSPGHLVDLDGARDLVLAMAGPYRIPDVQRDADHACRMHRRGEVEQGWHDLGTLSPVRPAWEA